MAELLWNKAEWIAEAQAWIHTELERRNLRVTGEIEQPRPRPWSTVMPVPTDGGLVYFKATSPMLAQETGLTLALARWHPEGMPELLAADTDRHWMLMRDGGVSLRSLLQADRDIRRWHEALRIYAETQIALSTHAEEIRALGTPDRRLVTLPALYEDLLNDTETLLLGQEEGLTAAEYAQLRALTPYVGALCERLAAFGIPESIQHDDFHDGNIFVRDDRVTIADWGDCCVSHPFSTLLVTLRSVEWTLQLEETAPESLHLRDVYLQSWTPFAPLEELQVALDIAMRLGKISRALTWRQVLNPLSKSDKQGNETAVAGWMRDFLNTVQE
jgi:hypothetical protein